MSRVPRDAPPGSAAAYCRLCGEPTGKETYDGATQPPSSAHHQCEARLQLEPPRFCAQCGRRLKVQVTPLGWSGICSRHGTTFSGAGTPNRSRH